MGCRKANLARSGSIGHLQGRSPAPSGPEGSYELESSDGGTRLTFRLACSPRRFAKAMTPMVAKTMRLEVSQLDRLRSILET